jgi:DNA-binding transcriptional LysR family regulator
VEQEMESKDPEPRGRLRVSASLLLGQVHVLPLLLSFLEKAPRVALDLELSDRAVDLVSERVDVAVRITNGPPPSFVARRVGSVSNVLCASPAYLKAHGAPRSLSDLAQHSCLQLLDSAALDSVARGPRVSARLRFSSSVALHEAARAGLGIADLPGYLVEGDLRAHRLTRVLAKHEPPARSVYVIYGAGSLLPTRVREVVRHLERGLKKVLS